MRCRTLITAVAGLVVLGTAACGGDTAPATTAGPTTTAPSTTAAVTTTAAPTTITTTTAVATTTTAIARFTTEDLGPAVLQDGDPWVVPIDGVEALALTLDDIWPADQFPTERAVYEEAGFVAGSFGMFTEDGALVLTGAHLFATADGAAAALAVIEESFNDLDLVARITGLAPGSLNMALSMGALEFGDATAAMILSGPEAQVVGIIWTTDNLLQFVRIGMALGDEDRSAAALDIAQAMADRLG
jgi:hypothetical protein